MGFAHKTIVFLVVAAFVALAAVYAVWDDARPVGLGEV